jgi:hypothetical protein
MLSLKIFMLEFFFLEKKFFLKECENLSKNFKDIY